MLPDFYTINKHAAEEAACPKVQPPDGAPSTHLVDERATVEGGATATEFAWLCIVEDGRHDDRVGEARRYATCARRADIISSPMPTPDADANFFRGRPRLWANGKAAFFVPSSQ